MSKIKQFFALTNIFKTLLVGAVLVISSYVILNIDKSETTNSRLLLLSQVMMIVILVVNGIEGVKAADETKRYLAYFNFLGAFVMLLINISILFKIWWS